MLGSLCHSLSLSLSVDVKLKALKARDMLCHRLLIGQLALALTLTVRSTMPHPFRHILFVPCLSTESSTDDFGKNALAVRYS